MTAEPEPERGIWPAPPTALVLVSGMLGDESLWRGVIERFEPTHDILCLRSDAGSTVADLAAGALAVAPPTFALAGHSLGGIVALEMQRQAPHRVLRLALLSASARPGSPAQQESWSTLRSRALRGDFTAIANDLAVATLPAHHRTPSLLAHALAMANVVGPTGLLRQLAAQATRPDSRPTLAAIDVPTMVVIGVHDEVCPPDLQHEVAKSIPGAVTELIASAGHLSPLEAPDEVAMLLHRWWSAASAPTASHSLLDPQPEPFGSPADKESP